MRRQSHCYWKSKFAKINTLAKNERKYKERDLDDIVVCAKGVNSKSHL